MQSGSGKWGGGGGQRGVGGVAMVFASGSVTGDSLLIQDPLAIIQPAACHLWV